MSDQKIHGFSLYEIVQLIRQEIKASQVGNVKKITGPAGPKGEAGPMGPAGSQGQRGDKGDRGDEGPRGKDGKTGPKGAKGEDGADGVGIARIDSELDNAFTVVLTDGTTYEIEMPLVTSGNPTEVVYKVSGGGGSSGGGGGGDGSGSIDLSNYVKRPPSTFHGSWLVYKEEGGTRTWNPVTTDLIATNPDVAFRDAKGQFRSTKDYAELTDQMKVNRFIANELDSINVAIDNIDTNIIYDDTELRDAIASEANDRAEADKALQEQIDALNDDRLTAEEKKRRLTAIWQYRGMLELDDDGKPIAPWEELDASGEWGEAELGGWYANSTEPPKYGRWKIGDADWLWIQPTQMSWDNESESWRGMDTSRMVPKNVGDTFTLDINEINVDVWNGDEIYVWGMPARFEFRVEEIFYPKSPAGNDQSYAPMIRVSHVRDEDHYKFWLPESPLYGDAVNGYDLLVDVHPSAVNVTTNDLYATKEDLEAIDIPEVDLGPVEERLDSIEEVLPKVPLVIEPADIGQQVCEITESRPTGASGKAGSVLIWKSETGGPANPFNEAKFICPDTSAIVLGVRTIWWKQGERVQRWDMSGNGWFTNGNVLHYSAVETSGDELVDGQPIELYYVDPNSTTDDLLDVISRVESKADDRRLQAEIEEIALILGTIANSIESGYYEYVGDSIPTQPGQFSLTFTEVTTAENIITFNEKDSDGATHNLPSTVDVDDYLEIVDQEHPEQFGLWQVTAVPDGTGIFSVQAKLVKAGSNFDLNDRCEVRFFSVTDALDINELDARYLQIKDADFVSKVGGDVMEGPLHVKGHSDDSRGTSRIKTLGVFSDSGSALRLGTTTDRIYIEDENTKFNGGIMVNNIGPKTEDGRGVTLNVEGSNDKHLVTKKYVDDAVQSGVDGIDFPETDLSGLVPLDGSKTMTGTLTAPRVNIKTTDYGDGVLLVEGKRDNTNNVSARVTFSNSANTNAYGSIEWYATNGSNGQFRFSNKVLLKKPPQTNAEGFTIKGYIDGSQPNGDLLKVYHNANSQDAILYKGKQQDDQDHLATTKWVVGKIAAIDIPETDLTGYATEEWVTGEINKIPAATGSLVSTSFRCKWNSASSNDGFTFYTQQSNGSAISSHQSTKFINIRLPSDFWTVKAGVVPAGRDTGYITVIDPANGQIIYSAEVISVSGGGTTFKVDCNKDLYTNNPTYWTADKNYLIRMESCFREA